MALRRLSTPPPVGPRPALRHVSDTEPGIRRRRRGGGFSYVAADGKPVRSAAQRERFDALGIPPAWTDVWICSDPLGHIQATGLDAAGRKQYRYHPRWSEWRAQVKYHQLLAFGKALPALRRRVRQDLEGPPGEADFSVAALVLLLDHAHLRVGSRRHTRRSGTFGATTLRARHVDVRPDGSVRLRFQAKGGKRVQRTCATGSCTGCCRRSTTCPDASSSPGSTTRARCARSLPSRSTPTWPRSSARRASARRPFEPGRAAWPRSPRPDAGHRP
nr:hypothetical protein [Alkalisalibacterium limincola]